MLTYIRQWYLCIHRPHPSAPPPRTTPSPPTRPTTTACAHSTLVDHHGKTHTGSKGPTKRLQLPCGVLDNLFRAGRVGGGTGREGAQSRDAAMRPLPPALRHPPDAPPMPTLSPTRPHPPSPFIAPRRPPPPPSATATPVPTACRPARRTPRCGRTGAASRPRRAGRPRSRRRRSPGRCGPRAA